MNKIQSIKLTKIFFLVFGLFAFTSMKSQNNYELNIEKKYGAEIIAPSFLNIFMGLLDKNFIDVLKEHGYSYNSSDGSYIADTNVGSPYYTIKKSYNEIIFIWTKDYDFNSKVRNQLNDMETPKYLGNNAYLYKIKTKNNSIINITFKTIGDGGMVIASYR